MKNKLYLATEFIVLYLVLPVIFWFDLIPVPKIAALLSVTLFCIIVLWFDKQLDFSQLFRQSDSMHFKSLVWRGGAVAGVILVLAALFEPSGLFHFPRREPVVWMVVMLLYPLLSALPQELVYREYFFQRYKSLYPSEIMLGYASALAFSFLHIIYDNWWAMGLSLAGGLMFVHTYRNTRSLYWVSIEHALYGCIVFTTGMGGYFYEPF